MQNTPELANLQASIETGDADVVQGLGSEQAAALEGNPDVVLYEGLTTLLAYVGMNALQPPSDNPDVREAIRYAVNYDEIITLLGGKAQLVQEIIPIGFLGHTGENPFTQDIDKAKELLAGAGVAEGTEIDFLVPTGTGPGGIEWGTLGAKIQDDLAQGGLVAKIRQLQTSELLNIYRAQDGKLVLHELESRLPGSGRQCHPVCQLRCPLSGLAQRLDDPTAIEMSQAAAIELDPNRRAELYGELVDYVMHNGPYVMLHQPTRVFGLRTNVEGFVYDPNDTPGVSFWLDPEE